MNKPVENIPFIAEDISASYRAGMASERRMIVEDILAPIFAAWERAKADPKAKLPTPLMAAIENARAKFK